MKEFYLVECEDILSTTLEILSKSLTVCIFKRFYYSRKSEEKQGKAQRDKQTPY